MLGLVYVSATALLGMGVLGSVAYLLVLTWAGACAPQKGPRHDH